LIRTAATLPVHGPRRRGIGAAVDSGGACGRPA